jgi:hypothetical protein
LSGFGQLASIGNDFLRMRSAIEPERQPTPYTSPRTTSMVRYTGAAARGY